MTSLTRRATLGGVALFGLGLCLGAARPALAEDTFLVKRTFKKGETHRYKTVTKITGESPMGALEIENDLVTEETVADVKDDGTTHLKVKTISLKSVFNGQERPAPNGGMPEYTLIYDKAGKLMKREEGAAPGRRGMGGLVNVSGSFEFPDRPLKAKEEFKFELPANDARQSKVNGVFTYLGKEPKSETLAAETVKAQVAIETEMMTPMGSNPLKLKGTLYLLPESGVLLKAEFEAEDLKLGPLEGAKMKVTRTLLKPEEKKG